jgi:hypothetical protein
MDPYSRRGYIQQNGVRWPAKGLTQDTQLQNPPHHRDDAP